MWESFNQLPLWLKAIIIIVPMEVLTVIGASIAIKILKSEKVEVGKDAIKLEDNDNGHEQQNKVDQPQP